MSKKQRVKRATPIDWRAFMKATREVYDAMATTIITDPWQAIANRYNDAARALGHIESGVNENGEPVSDMLKGTAVASRLKKMAHGGYQQHAGAKIIPAADVETDKPIDDTHRARFVVKLTGKAWAGHELEGQEVVCVRDGKDGTRTIKLLDRVKVGRRGKNAGKAIGAQFKPATHPILASYVDTIRAFVAQRSACPDDLVAEFFS